MLDDTTLSTPRLQLRRFREEDAPALHEIFKDPEVMRYWSTPPHASLYQTRDWIRHTIESTARGHADDFIVEHNQHVIGKAGLWKDNELGFLFARDVWGRGFASEALRALLDRAFARGTPVIAADVDPRNARSIALLTKLGFHQISAATHTFQVGDHWVDSIYFELPNDQH